MATRNCMKMRGGPWTQGQQWSCQTRWRQGCSGRRWCGRSRAGSWGPLSCRWTPSRRPWGWTQGGSLIDCDWLGWKRYMRLPAPHMVVQWHITTVHHCLSQHDVVDVPGLVGLAKLDSLYVDIDQKYLKGSIFTERLLHWPLSVYFFKIYISLYSHVLFLLVHNMIA